MFDNKAEIYVNLRTSNKRTAEASAAQIYSAHRLRVLKARGHDLEDERARLEITRSRCPTTKGYVYAISYGAFSGVVKIGRALSLKNRLSAYNTGCPDKGYQIVASFWAPDCFDMERRVLSEFPSEGLSGEWRKASRAQVLEVFSRLALEAVEP